MEAAVSATPNTGMELEAVMRELARVSPDPDYAGLLARLHVVKALVDGAWVLDDVCVAATMALGDFECASLTQSQAFRVCVLLRTMYPLFPINVPGTSRREVLDAFFRGDLERIVSWAPVRKGGDPAPDAKGNLYHALKPLEPGVPPPAGEQVEARPAVVPSVPSVPRVSRVSRVPGAPGAPEAAGAPGAHIETPQSVNQHPPAHKVAISASKRDAPSVNGPARPASSSAPASSTSAPIVNDSVPTVKGSVPAVKVAAQAVKVAAAAVKVAAPAMKVAAPAMKVAAPAMKVASPAMKVAAPAVKVATPAVKAAAPAVKGYAPLEGDRGGAVRAVHKQRPTLEALKAEALRNAGLRGSGPRKGGAGEGQQRRGDVRALMQPARGERDVRHYNAARKLVGLSPVTPSGYANGAYDQDVAAAAIKSGRVTNARQRSPGPSRQGPERTTPISAGTAGSNTASHPPRAAGESGSKGATALSGTTAATGIADLRDVLQGRRRGAERSDSPGVGCGPSSVQRGDGVGVSAERRAGESSTAAGSGWRDLRPSAPVHPSSSFVPEGPRDKSSDYKGRNDSDAPWGERNTVALSVRDRGLRSRHSPRREIRESGGTPGRRYENIDPRDSPSRSGAGSATYSRLGPEGAQFTPSPERVPERRRSPREQPRRRNGGSPSSSSRAFHGPSSNTGHMGPLGRLPPTRPGQSFRGEGRQPPYNAHGPPQNAHGPPQNAHGPPRNAHGPPQNAHGPPRNGHGPPQNAHGPPQNAHGPPRNAHGPPHNAHGPPHNAHGPPLNAHGPPLNAHGPPHMQVKRKPLPALIAEPGPDATMTPNRFGRGGVERGGHGPPPVRGVRGMPPLPPPNPQRYMPTRAEVANNPERYQGVDFDGKGAGNGDGGNKGARWLDKKRGRAARKQHMSDEEWRQIKRSRNEQDGRSGRAKARARPKYTPPSWIGPKR